MSSEEENIIVARTRQAWGEGLKLIAIADGRIPFTGEADGNVQVCPITVQVPPGTKALHIIPTGVETPQDIAASNRVQLGGLTFKVAAKRDTNRDVVVENEKVLVNVAALVRRGTGSGPWSMNIDIEILCFG